MPVCLTQQQIDKYAAIIPPIGDCHVTNLVKKANGMTADLVCTGKMSGTASLESTWSDDEHATGKVHFVGSMQVGPNVKAIERGLNELVSEEFKPGDSKILTYLC